MAKNKTIKVYVSDDEFNFINEKAKKCNTPISTYLRQSGLRSTNLLKPEKMCEIMEFLNSINSKYPDEWMQQKTDELYKKLEV